MLSYLLRHFLSIILCLLALALPRLALADAKTAFVLADAKDWVNAREQAKSDPVLLTLISWQYLLDPDSGAGFDEITRFISEHPDWPEQKKLRIRAELSLRDSHPARDDIISWFGDAMPITGVGKIALAEALMDSATPPAERITYLIRDGWKSGDFDESQEKDILAHHGGLLRADDDIIRIDRLLWDEKTTEAERMLSRVPENQQKLAKARIALILNKKTAVAAVGQVDAKLKKDPGLIYDRMRYRSRRDDNDGVREMLLLAPKTVAYPDKWWRYREPQVRKAIADGKYTAAEKLLANHGQVEGRNVADAVWLSGWLQLEFKDQPKTAYDIFYRLYDTVSYPASRSRAAYWAGRAAEKAGDKDTASNWYNTASSFPTTFYGQLGALKYYGEAPLHIPAEATAGSSDSFNGSDIVSAIKLAADSDEDELVERLINYLGENATTDDQAILTAELGKRIGKNYLSVHAAKKALRRNLVLLGLGYPHPATPSDAPIERALTLAITRQESEFDPKAKSPSGALGMMQLLPGTAKETAKKNDIAYDRDRLWDADYNFTLGSAYLGRLIDSYSGSYVMAIAAYNGGPGNVRNWAAQFGTPGGSVESAIDWIEKIPFSETRNYVQRVLENVQIYRAIEAGDEAPKLKLGDDLVR